MDLHSGNYLDKGRFTSWPSWIWEGGQDWPIGTVGALSAVNGAVQSRNNGPAERKLSS